MIVRDMRHLDSPEQLFMSILEHLEIATNAGKVLLAEDLSLLPPPSSSSSPPLPPPDPLNLSFDLPLM